jgi:hypothetical protein
MIVPEDIALVTIAKHAGDHKLFVELFDFFLRDERGLLAGFTLRKAQGCASHRVLHLILESDKFAEIGVNRFAFIVRQQMPVHDFPLSRLYGPTPPERRSHSIVNMNIPPLICLYVSFLPWLSYLGSKIFIMSFMNLT